MAGADRAEFASGYDGAIQTNKGLSQEGDTVHGLSKKMFGHGQDVLGTTKGSFGMQISNATTADADLTTANARMHHSAAEGNARFVSQSGHHEQDAADGTRTVAANTMSASSDLYGRIHPV